MILLEPEDMFDKFTDLTATNEDIQKSLSLDFQDKWSGKMMMTPVVFIDWAQMWATMRLEHPDLLGDWTTPLFAGDDIKDVLGELAEPFADFVRLSRHSSILQHVNLYTGLGYLELIFDVEKGVETYQLSEKALSVQSDIVQSKLKQLVEAYGNF